MESQLFFDSILSKKVKVKVRFRTLHDLIFGDLEYPKLSLTSSIEGAASWLRSMRRILITTPATEFNREWHVFIQQHWRTVVTVIVSYVCR